MSLLHSSGAYRSQISAIALNMLVKVRAAIRRRCALGLENTISIGLESGLYGGKKKNQHPAHRFFRFGISVRGEIVQTGQGSR